MGEGEHIDHDAYHRLEDMFVEGYRAARDKLVYLRLAHIPFELPAQPDTDADGAMHLQNLRITEEFKVGSVAPAFGSSHLIHQMFPSELVEARRSLAFIYVHPDGAAEKTLRELLGLVIDDPDHHHG